MAHFPLSFQFTRKRTRINGSNVELDDLSILNSSIQLLNLVKKRNKKRIQKGLDDKSW